MLESLPINRESHLAPGVKPIIVCLISESDFNRNEIAYIEQKFRGGKNTRNIDYYAKSDIAQQTGLLNAGEYTYVMSPVDDLDKYSLQFADCTGVVVVGKDKKTGTDLSFMSHQDPQRFLSDKLHNFTNDFKSRLGEIKERCQQGSVDAVVIGGRYYVDDESYAKKMDFRQEYVDAVKMLSEEVSKMLGFKPMVVNGPKTTYGRDHIFYDNTKRNLYFLRPKVQIGTNSFTADDIETERKKWERKL